MTSPLVDDDVIGMRINFRRRQIITLALIENWFDLFLVADCYAEFLQGWRRLGTLVEPSSLSISASRFRHFARPAMPEEPGSSLIMGKNFAGFHNLLSHGIDLRLATIFDHSATPSDDTPTQLFLMRLEVAHQCFGLGKALRITLRIECRKIERNAGIFL
jgi:hypothetical protein